MSDVIRNPEPSGEALADGVFLHRIQPGGRRGPHDEVLRETPGVRAGHNISGSATRPMIST